MYTGFDPSDSVNVDPSLNTSEKSGAAGPSTPDGVASGSAAAGPVVSGDTSVDAGLAAMVVTTLGAGSP